MAPRQSDMTERHGRGEIIHGKQTDEDTLALFVLLIFYANYQLRADIVLTFLILSRSMANQSVD